MELMALTIKVLELTVKLKELRGTKYITEVLEGALDSLSEEAEPLGLRVSWIKTKVQAFGDILDATVESIPVNGENVEVTQTFTYLGSVIHSSTNCELEVKRRLGRAWSAS